jgi:hypothetical protein
MDQLSRRKIAALVVAQSSDDFAMSYGTSIESMKGLGISGLQH